MLKSPLRAYRASGTGNCADVIELAVAIAYSPRINYRSCRGLGIMGNFSSWQIVLQKSFCITEHKFCEP
jgi:hypothetical protein